jgi:hypothetical protein
MRRKFRDFMIGGVALLPCLLWLFTGSVEVFAVSASLMLLSTIIVAMALPPSSDPPEEPH